ncbi:MAG: hypothetical protein U0Y10_23535 [Spirosomataceae bacterium]
MIDSVVQHIAQLQDSAERRYFPEGVFASYRENPQWGYRRPDTNIFFTAITVFTLLKIKPLLSADSQLLVELIHQKAIQNYPAFQNKDGLLTYNFFQTKPSQHFPHGYIMRHFEHFRIPDDVDDTAFIYLTQPHTQADAQWLHQKLQQHCNLAQGKQIRNTFPEFRHLKAYSTWFGKNMYIEFDVCVLSNLLYCLCSFDLPLNQHDMDSLTYIREVIVSGKHRTHPFQVAHQYPRTVPIIYHVSRLLAAFPLPAIEPCRAVLIQDANELLQQPIGWMDQLVLCTSLLRLGEPAPAINLPQPLKTAQFDDFYFFIAGLLTAFEQPFVYQQLAPLPFTHLRWTCEAYNWALVVEYLALKE